MLGTPLAPDATTAGTADRTDTASPAVAAPASAGRPGITTRLRRGRGVALRAGAGAAVLLGVTAGVEVLNQPAAEQAPATATADLLAGPSAVTFSDTLQEQTLLATQKAAAERSARIAAANRTARIAAANRTARIAAANRAARIAAANRAARAATAHRIAVANQAARAAAARQAAVAAKQRAAAAKQRAAAGTEASRSSSRDPRSAARALLAARGWSGQFGCLDSLWQRESGWNYRAYNASSGAYGIPQALPGGKMASAGADWRTNPVTQIRWGLGYIASTYGTPCGAWSHSQAYGWY